MSRVSVSEQFPGTVHEAQTLWYDTTRWPAWVDELAHVDYVSDGYPATGSTVRWHSGPAGRGRVTERVTAQETLAGQTVEVSDDSIDGEQTVSFNPVTEETVEVTLTLDYTIRKRQLFTPLVDALFVRRAMRTSLAKTLTHFGAELASARGRPSA